MLSLQISLPSILYSYHHLLRLVIHSYGSITCLCYWVIEKNYWKGNSFTTKKLLEIYCYIEKYLSQNTSEKEFSVAPLNNELKLPKIEIQPFDGQCDLWSGFYDNFQWAVHQNFWLSDIQKLLIWKAFCFIYDLWF